MFIACPHCRELVAPHPLTRQLPPTCPRCGGNLPGTRAATTDTPAQTAAVSGHPAGAAAPSLVTLLRPANADDAGSAAAQPDAGIESTATRAVAAPPSAKATTAVPSNAAIATLTDAGTGDVTIEASAETAQPSAATPGADSDLADVAVSEPATAVRADERLPAAAADESARASGHPASPSFLQRRRSAQPQPSAARWQWGVVAVLTLLLVLQVLLADRERLAADAGWRPLIGGLCGVLGCSMPAWREPQALTMLNRDVRPLPQAPGVLLAKATFRNDARWAQPWPVLLLTLKDADGRSLGARALLPADYLDAAASNDIAPGQTAEITVRVREPSASVVAFAFDFH